MAKAAAKGLMPTSAVGNKRGKPVHHPRSPHSRPSQDRGPPLGTARTGLHRAGCCHCGFCRPRPSPPQPGPGSLRPTHHPSQCSGWADGFSLLELLIVIVIVAVAAAAVSLAVPSTAARQLTQEGERLAALLEAARARSRASGLVVTWHTGHTTSPSGPADLTPDLPRQGFEFRGPGVAVLHDLAPPAAITPEGNSPRRTTLGRPTAAGPALAAVAPGRSGAMSSASSLTVPAAASLAALPVLPLYWLHPTTRAEPARLVLGPEPVIAPQRIVLLGEQGQRLEVRTDGVRPFTVATPADTSTLPARSATP